MSEQNVTPDLQSAVQNSLRDAAGVLIFSEADDLLYTNLEAHMPGEELSALRSVYEGRDTAISSGMVLLKQRYEVHKYHPPMVYGRTMDGDPEHSTGAALCRVAKGLAGEPVYAFISFQLPNLTARMVAKLQEFCEKHLSNSSTVS